jgi:uncharacterized membrane protein
VNPSAAPDPLDAPATITRLTAVLDALAVPPGARAAVLAVGTRTPSALEWRRFLASALLLVGTGLLLSGVVSFFAFNWAALGKLGKFALLAAGVSGCALAAVRAPDSLVSRVLLFAASVLLGALLAVYGQTYQTGADPWGLFGVWALLILPWTLAACFTPLWLLWIALVDLAFGLYVAQVLATPRWDVTTLVGIVAVHVLAVMALEAKRLRTPPWHADTWGPRVLVAVTLLPLVMASVVAVGLQELRGDVTGASLGLLTFLVVLFGAYYQFVRRDTFMLTAVAGAVVVVLTVALARPLLELGLFGLLLITALLVGEVAVIVKWLRQPREVPA